MKKICLLNMQNKDDRSFLYYVVAAFKRPDRNASRLEFYKPYVNKLITAGRNLKISRMQLAHKYVISEYVGI